MDGMRWILALIALMGLASAAMSCETYYAGELNEWHLVSCYGAAANSSCHAIVNETVSGRQVDLYPVDAFNVYHDSLYATDDGVVAYPLRFRPDIYYEGVNYTITTFCGDESASTTVLMGGYQGAMQPLGSVLKWASDNTFTLALFAGVGFVSLCLLFVAWRSAR